MDFPTEMHSYFRGEKLEALIFILPAGLAVIGLALPFAVPFEWALAAGPVLVVAGGIGMLIDGFAERRTRPYMAALEDVAGMPNGETAPNPPD